MSESKEPTLEEIILRACAGIEEAVKQHTEMLEGFCETVDESTKED